jgi:hypothetical protein
MLRSQLVVRASALKAQGSRGGEFAPLHVLIISDSLRFTMDARNIIADTLG